MKTEPFHIWYPQYVALLEEYDSAHIAAVRAGHATMEPNLTHEQWLYACDAEVIACRRADELMEKLHAFHQ